MLWIDCLSEYFKWSLPSPCSWASGSVESKYGCVARFQSRAWFDSALVSKCLFDVYRLCVAWWISQKCQTLFSSSDVSGLKWKPSKELEDFTEYTGLKVKQTSEEVSSVDVLRHPSRALPLSVWETLSYKVGWRLTYHHFAATWMLSYIPLLLLYSDIYFMLPNY